MDVTPTGPKLPGITHHRAGVNGTKLHYVAAGTSGSPVLLVHGFPETWWAFPAAAPPTAPPGADPRRFRLGGEGSAAGAAGC
jgi:pimeloyl-ACP methyl ester carboxylesterase